MIENFSTYLVVGFVTILSIISFYLGQLYHDWTKLTSGNNSIGQLIENFSNIGDIFKSFQIPTNQQTKGTASIKEIDGSDDELLEASQMPTTSVFDPNTENPFGDILKQFQPMMQQMQPMVSEFTEELGSVFQSLGEASKEE